MHTLIQQWHELLRSGDPSKLPALLSDSVVFHSPVLHAPQIGRDLTEMYLLAALQGLYNDSFHYVREVVGDNDAALEFVVEHDGIVINGVDLIRWDEQQKITDFKVMIRPYRAIDKVREIMLEALASIQSG